MVKNGNVKKCFHTFKMYIDSCENCTIKKAEHRRIDAFGLWCWEKTLESPLNSKEIQSLYPKGN